MRTCWVSCSPDMGMVGKAGAVAWLGRVGAGLAFGEPLGVSPLAALTDGTAWSRTKPGAGGGPPRRASAAGPPIPRYSEVVRERTGPLHAHRVRGRIAVVLAVPAAGGPMTPARRRADAGFRPACRCRIAPLLHGNRAALGTPANPIRVPDYSSHRPRPRARW
jgi:hypothetical protein